MSNTTEPGKVYRCPDYVAAKYDISPRTLQGWRLKGIGPRFVRINHKVVRYSDEELARYDAELAARDSTSAESAAAE